MQSTQEQTANIAIKHITYHILQKEKNGEARKTLNPKKHKNYIPNEVHQKFLEQLTQAYTGRAGKGFGIFEDDDDIYLMPRFLKEYNGNKDFKSLTEKMMSILLKEISKQPLATGGKVFISHYEHQGCDYMLIAILLDRTGFSADDWEIKESEVLDIEHLKYAGRINLTAWQANEKRYISFLRGSSDVSAYFKAFLSCNDVFLATQETKKLIGMLEDFTIEQGYDLEQKDAFLNEAKSYLEELSNNGDVFIAEKFANRVFPSNPQLLKDKLSDADTGIQDGFTPDKRSLRSLVIYVGKTKNWTLSFDRDSIVEGNIALDELGNGIYKVSINNPPKELIETLKTLV